MKVKDYLSAAQWDFAEVMVVDDGSVDNTVQLARDAGVRVLQNPGNRGKGYSVKHGMLEAKGEWALFTDADLSSPIDEVEKLWSALERDTRRSPSARAPSTARWSACISLSSAKRSAASSMPPCGWSPDCPSRTRSAASSSFRPAPAVKFSRRQQLDGFGFDVEVLFIAKTARA